jgi:nucleoside-diphosphate-sugar epimerase
MTKQRVLIPGGAGYIGSHIVLCVLLTRKYTVTGEWPRRSPPAPCSLC